jgi:hypothetical protein
MEISEKLLQEREYCAEGYCPLVDFGTWRVAVLNYSADLLPENLTAMQRHNETDEVFVLLRGRCVLFLGEGDEAVTTIHARLMKPFKLYNIRKAVWHTHTLSPDATVLIVENRDTTFDNSPFCALTKEQQQKIVTLNRTVGID